MDIFQ